MSVHTPNDDLIVELLGWLGERGRPYADVMVRWRSSCPRLAIWEDVLGMGLVRSVGWGSADGERVVLTAKGRRVLAEQAPGSCLAADARPGAPGSS